MVMESCCAALKFPDRYFDFVYIDAKHDFKSVYRDISLWKPKVRKGGLLCGHDYINEEEPGVREAVDRLLTNVQHTQLEGGAPDPYPSWWVIND